MPDLLLELAVLPPAPPSRRPSFLAVVRSTGAPAAPLHPEAAGASWPAARPRRLAPLLLEPTFAEFGAPPVRGPAVLAEKDPLVDVACAPKPAKARASEPDSQSDAAPAPLLLLKPTFLDGARHLAHVRRMTNPKMKLVPLVVGDRRFTLLDDGPLVGGTKQRLLGRFVGESPHTEFVYAGPNIGIAQLALAYTCALWGKQAVVFLNSPSTQLDPYTQLAISYGARIHHAPRRTGRTLADTQAAARAYVARRSARCKLLPFGLHALPGEPLFDFFREALVDALPKDMKSPKRLWMVAGSGFLFSVLHSIWPSTELLIVQVGRTIWPDQLEGMKVQLFVAPEKFGETAIIQPPYRSVPNYDAKVYQFVLEHGKDGDFIWNVASK